MVRCEEKMSHTSHTPHTPHTTHPVRADKQKERERERERERKQRNKPSRDVEQTGRETVRDNYAVCIHVATYIQYTPLYTCT